jgi:hypothetical protein
MEVWILEFLENSLVGKGLARFRDLVTLTAVPESPEMSRDEIQS